MDRHQTGGMRWCRVGSVHRWMVLSLAAAALALPGRPLFAATPESDLAPGRVMAQQATREKEMWITSDHAKHAALQQAFTSGPEVTQACLSCHNQAALQFHQTIHWTWMDPRTEASARLGKGGLSVNNF